MKLILLTYPDNYADEVSILNQLFAQGLEILHIRKPSWSVEQQRVFLNAICPEYYSRIVLHDHYELHEEFEIGGIHLSERNGKLWKQFEGLEINKSLSCHSIQEVRELDNTVFSYAFLSPVFDSISKKGYTAQFDEEELGMFLLKNKATEVVALGGVSLLNCLQCREMGFYGIALLGAVWNSGNPLEAFKLIQKLCQENVLLY